jgi:hypothetical protein
LAVMSRSTGESFRLQWPEDSISSAIKSWSFWVEYVEPEIALCRVFEMVDPVKTSRARST